MFGTIRKHQTWLWAIIITFTIISFVVFFSPYSRMQSGQGEVRLGSISGEKITEEAFINAQKDSMLQYFFMSGGRFPEEDAKRMGYDLERETYQWLFLLKKAEELGINTSDEMVVQVARNMLSQFQQAGFSTPATFHTQVLQPRGFRMEDFERFVRNYLNVQQLVSTLGAGGRLVTPAEARELYVRENQEVATEMVVFNPSNYLASVNVTDQELRSFFTNRLAAYRIPQRVQVKYVEFEVTNHWADAAAELAKTNLEEIVQINLERLGTNFTRIAKTPEEAKARIKEELIRNRALIEARRRANSFASTLFDITPARPELLEEMARSNGIPVKTSEPVASGDIPKGISAGPAFSAAAFRMDLTNEPFGGPVVGTNAVYVLAFGKRLPSETPSFEAVKDDVMQDYKMERASMLARTAGITFHQRLTNAMSQGKQFAEVAREAKLDVIQLPPFSIATRSLPGFEERGDLNQLKELAFSTEPGKVSTFQPLGEGGAILHVKSKLPIDEARLNSQLPEFVNAVRQNRQTEAFNNWFRKEAPVALRDTPLNAPRETPPPSMSEAGKKS